MIAGDASRQAAWRPDAITRARLLPTGHAVGPRRSPAFYAETMGTVDVGAVAAHARDYGFAYLITINSHQRVHTSVVHPEFSEDAVTVPGASGRARANAGAHPEVSVVWPPPDATGYSLILDGTATADERAGASGAPLRIVPSRAILHRPAAEPSAPGAADGCVQDCVEL